MELISGTPGQKGNQPTQELTSNVWDEAHVNAGIYGPLMANPSGIPSF